MRAKVGNASVHINWFMDGTEFASGGRRSRTLRYDLRKGTFPWNLRRSTHSLTAAALRPVLVGRSNIYIHPIYSSCPATSCYTCPSTMSSPSPSQWLTLPVEIQLTITQLLDNNTLHSLSEVSHYNRILCLPAVYSVRSYSPSPSHPHSQHPTHIHIHSHAEHMYRPKPVGHHTIIRQAPIFPGSRASPPCVPYPHTRHQHRWLSSCRRQCGCYTGDLLRRPSSNTIPHSLSEDPFPQSLYRTVSAGDIIILHS